MAAFALDNRTSPQLPTSRRQVANHAHFKEVTPLNSQSTIFKPSPERALAPPYRQATTCIPRSKEPQTSRRSTKRICGRAGKIKWPRSTSCALPWSSLTLRPDPLVPVWAGGQKIATLRRRSSIEGYNKNPPSLTCRGDASRTDDSHSCIEMCVQYKEPTCENSRVVTTQGHSLPLETQQRGSPGNDGKNCSSSQRVARHNNF